MCSCAKNSRIYFLLSCAIFRLFIFAYWVQNSARRNHHFRMQTNVLTKYSFVFISFFSGRCADTFVFSIQKIVKSSKTLENMCGIFRAKHFHEIFATQAHIYLSGHNSQTASLDITFFTAAQNSFSFSVVSCPNITSDGLVKVMLGHAATLAFSSWDLTILIFKLIRHCGKVGKSAQKHFTRNKKCTGSKLKNRELLKYAL